MPRVPLDDFSDREIARIYLAGELAEAQRVENILNANNIDYAVEIERYVRFIVFLFPSEHAAAAFYVLASHAELCRRALTAAGLTAGIVEEPLS